MKKRLAYALGTCCVFVLVSMVFLRFPDSRQAQLEYFSRALQTPDAIESVYVDDRMYSVTGGEVAHESGEPVSPTEKLSALKLAYALSMIQNVPLLSLEGTDIQLLRSGLIELEASRDALSALQETPTAARRVAEDLYPIEFLHALIDLELARRDALTTRTEDSYTTYTDLLRRALTSANRDLSRFTRSYKDAVRPQHERTATLNGLISKDVTLKALEILAARFGQVESEGRARKACIAGLLYECGTTQQQTVTSPTKQSRRDEVHVRRVLSIFDEVRGTTDARRTIVGLEKSSCIQGLNGADYVEVRSLDNPPFTAYAYVGDILIRRFSGDSGPALTWFTEQQMQYLPYNPLISYTCPQTASDISRAKSLAAIASTLFPPHAPTIVYESDLLEQLQRKVVEPSSTESQKETLARLYRQYVSGTSGFEDAVYDVVHGLRSALSMHKEGAPIDLDESILFATQSGYYGLFLAHNRTAGWEELLPYAANTSEHFWKNFFRYSQNSAVVKREILIRDVALFFSVHNK